MNRKERRQTSKRLGILQYQQKLPLKKKLALIRENIIQGKQMHQEYVENNRIIQEQFRDEVISNELYFRANDIAKREAIPFVDAIDKAKKEMLAEEIKKKNSEKK
jgi:hypothetical protein